MTNGLAELRQSNFKNALMFAAYFDKQDKPFLTADMKKALRGALAVLGSGQGVYLSVVNDVVEGPGKSVQKDPGLVSRLMATDASRTAHRRELLALLAVYPFKGLELDYERVTMEDWPKLLQFAHELSTTLATQGKKLRLVMEPKQKYLQGDLPVGPQYVVMAYNLHGSHNGPGAKADDVFLRQLAQWCAHWPVKPGLALSAIPCRSITTFPATAIWPSASAASSAFTFRKTSTIPTVPAASRNSGGGGIFPLAAGSGIISISRWAATGRGRDGSC